MLRRVYSISLCNFCAVLYKTIETLKSLMDLNKYFSFYGLKLTFSNYWYEKPSPLVTLVNSTLSGLQLNFSCLHLSLRLHLLKVTFYVQL